MLKDSSDQSIRNERAIFPIISFNSKKKIFRCLGTGFFINQLGWFVTAKHILYDNYGDFFPMLIGIQTLTSGVPVSRLVTHLSIHPTADIAIGQLGDARDGKAQKVPYEFAPIFHLSFKKLNVLDNVISYGYPKTSRTVNGSEDTFNFAGKWSTGTIESYLKMGVL